MLAQRQTLPTWRARVSPFRRHLAVGCPASSEAAADAAFETTVTRAIKLRRIRFVGLVARMGEINTEFLSKNVKIQRGQPKYSLEDGEMDLTAR